MSVVRWLTPVLAATVGLSTTAGWPYAAAAGDAGRPQSGVAASQPSASLSPIERGELEIRLWSARAQRDELDHLTPTKLAGLLLRQAGRTGDVRLYARAEQALNVALYRHPGHRPALALMSATYLAQHRFTDALVVARRSAESGAGAADDPECWAAVGDACLELGDLAGAEAEYAKLVRRLPGLFAFSRMANLGHAKGDTPAAVADFRRAIESGEGEGAPAEDLAWCHVQLGRLAFDRGDWDEARTQYESALRLVSGDRRARDHLAELQAAGKDYEAAVSAYRRLVEEFETPELCQALGDVYAAMDRPGDAAPWHDRALAGYLRAAAAGHAHYDHHLAGFYADVRRDGPEAVRWARKDLTRRRTPATLDALAWALYADGQFEEAAKTVDEALALPGGGGGASAHVLYHASLIHARRGDAARARDLARRAAEANPRFLAFHVHR